jgi:hypothetical protein
MARANKSSEDVQPSALEQAVLVEEALVREEMA